MSATKQKAKKTIAESVEIELPIENITNKKASKKPTVEKSNVTVEVIEVEVDEKGDIKKKKNPKVKVIRDSFSFPEEDYLKISELKKTCLAAGINVKKGEILRAGLHLLTQLTLDDLKSVIEQVEKVQTGRPASSKIYR
ncbi:hypothetical protein [Methylobacter sp. S3L5C]|uniref:hypothetical protein n=1 Tax=Methylobacter sp. S3L5C TaxID=2839024 RepID=UPI001FAD7B51|nr:hypothetical protein [Methylobacter sp. S3L5C]UOA10320.1 hypothetical protein KKZ03_08860 [Methylobacter sp. S3L5C]